MDIDIKKLPKLPFGPCGDCACFVSGQDGTSGACHRYPPLGITPLLGKNPLSGAPIVQGQLSFHPTMQPTHAGCWEFKRKGDPNVKPSDFII